MPQAQASHIVGGDVYYTCVSPNTYQITFQLYRDCQGIGMPTSLSVSFTAPNCGVTGPTVTFNPGTRFGVEITPVCPAALPQTTCNSGGTIQGTEVYEYTAQVTLPSGCDMWQFGWTTCCRNGNVTNIPAGSSFIGGQINNANGLCNNSARFTTLPTPYICAGQPFVFNHGAIDSDGDTLIYSLGPPLQTSWTTPNLTWNNGTSANQPFVTSPANSLVFSSNTGQMNFTPNGPQTAVLAVYVYEIRNGDTISVIMRDMQVVVLPNCTNTGVNNTPPLVSNGGTFNNGTFVVCQCDTLNFQVSLSDPDGDTITLDPIQSNIGQVFGPSNVTIFPFYPVPGRRDTMDLYVQIRTCTTDVATGSLSPVNAPGIYGFTIVGTDNACPLPLPAYLGFNVVIPGVTVVASDTAICAGIAQTLQLGAQTFSPPGTTVAGTYQWVQISGPPVTFSNDTISNPTIAVPGTTLPGQNIVLEVQFITAPDPVTGTFCTTSDRVNISLVNLPLYLDVRASDTSLCQNGLPNIVQMSTGVAGPGVDTVNGNYTWTANPISYQAGISNPTIGNPQVTAAGTPGSVAQYVVSYTYGVCTGSDTINLRFNPGVPVLNPAIDTICPGDTISIAASLSDTFFYPGDPNSYLVNSIPYNPQSCAAGTSAGVACDDCVSGALPIGFNFNFFGTTYSSFYASSNGFITFNSGVGSGCCSGQPMPYAFMPNTMIALAWTDLNPSSCGSVTYYTTGTAPNRMLVVCYNSVCYFGSSNTITGQIILHEGTNCVDIITTSQNSPTNTVTQGIQGQGGTPGIPVPGRNGTVWTATNSAYSFCQPIPFDPITYQWNPNFAISNDTLGTVSVWPAGSVTYQVQVSEGSCVMTDSVQIVVNSNLQPPNVTCGLPVNYPTEILFNWSGSAGATGWEYSIDSGLVWNPSPLGVDSLLMTGFTNGDCFQLQVRATGPSGACPTNAATIHTCCTQPCFNPTQIASTASSNLSCNQSQDGTITYLGTQGDQGPNYTYNMYNAATGAFVQGPLTTPGSVTFSGLAAGSYYVIGTDAFGCIATSDTVTLTQPAVLDATLVGTTLTACWNTPDGTASVTQVGGTGPYTYQWGANAGAQTTAMATGLVLGAYQVTVTDANGCQDVVTPINVFGPFAQAPVVTLTVTNSNGCPGNGTATILSVQSLQGDPNPNNPGSLNYVWTDMTGTVVATNTLSAPNLVAGMYAISITDTSGCSFIDTFQVNGASVNINTVNVDDADCNFANGSIDIDPVGDPGGYNYIWSNGATTQDLTGLGGGTYMVTVVGVGGCQDTASYTIDAGGITAVVSGLDDRVCTGESTGYINIDTSSLGGGAVTFLWSNSATTQNISGLSAGTYSVTVTLNGGLVCVANPVATIREPAQQMAVTVNGIDCENIQAIPSGGWGVGAGPIDYTFSWNTSDTTANLTITPGTYTVTATDEEGCTAVDSITIVEPIIDPWVVAVGITDTSLPVGLIIPMNAGPGTPEAGVTYTWEPSSLLQNPTNSHEVKLQQDLNDGCYTFTVTADNGVCVVSDTVRICLTPVSFTGFPSAFTPNPGGGTQYQNDNFRPTPHPVDHLEIQDFKVFNRWGQVVFDAGGDKAKAIEGWDGTLGGVLQPRDTYIYVFSYRLPGETEWTTIRGQTTLIR